MKLYFIRSLIAFLFLIFSPFSAYSMEESASEENKSYSAPASLNRLPLSDELWLMVFFNLQAKDRYALSLASKDFRRIVHDERLWKEKISLSHLRATNTISRTTFPIQHVYLRDNDYVSPDKVNNENLSNIAYFSHLKSLALYGYEIRNTNNALNYLKGITTLTALEINGSYTINKSNISIISLLIGLERLDLHAISLSDDELQPIGQSLTNLRELSFTGSNLTGEGLRWFQNPAGLTSLNLFGCIRITDDNYSYLSRMTNLKRLDLGSKKNANNTSKSLSHLTSLTNLENLSLSGWANITDLNLILVFPKLRSLDLSECLYLKKKTEDKEKFLSGISNLKNSNSNLVIQE